jgi:hypothetical protein
MRATVLTASLLATVLAKDAPTLLGRASTNATTGWCHPGYAQQSNATTNENRCIPCPAGTHSQGGVSSTCTTMADEWTTCSHLACELVESETHCNFHSSSNPKTDLARAAPLNTVAKVASSCHDIGDHNTSIHGEHHAGVQRISIFHHGSEQQGMVHKCSKNTGGVIGARGACECQCKRGFDYTATPTESVSSAMSLGGFTEETFTEHVQFAVQTAIANDFAVDVTHVVLSNIQFTASGGRRLQAATAGNSFANFDVAILCTEAQRSDFVVRVDSLSTDEAAQTRLESGITQVMVTEHISIEHLQLSLACEGVAKYHLMMGYAPYADGLPITAKPNGICSIDSRTTGDYSNQHGNDLGVTCCNSETLILHPASAATQQGSRPGCKKNYNFDQAKAWCLQNNQVLCSKAQISAGAGADTGCSFDHYHVWTRDACTEDVAA